MIALLKDPERLWQNSNPKGNMIDPRDLFSGCISVEKGYVVLTRNRKHFERILDLLVFETSDLI